MPRRRPEISAEDGQASTEYVGVFLLLAAIIGAALAVAGPALPGGTLARAVASKLVCAVKGAGSCGEQAMALAARPSAIERAYGAELAAIVAERAPTIWFEGDEFASLPVDFRDCRERSCADTISHGSMQHTQAGLEPTVFTHVVDCRDPAAAAAAGYDCSGERAGRIYFQYWLYYPDSHTRGLAVFGGYHADDWESYQVRVGPGADEAAARASSHHSYNGRDGGNIGADAGVTPRVGWDTILGELHVAAGSHAGSSARDPGDDRWITPSNQRLVPLEPIAAAGNAPPFTISPPWQKEVWSDPESPAT